MSHTRRRVLELLGWGGLGLVAGGRLVRKAHAHQPAALRTRLTDAYGLVAPIVGAGVGFYALPELVAAITNRGALGVLGAAPEPPPRMRELIRQTRAATSGLFGVDLVNTRLFGAGIPAVTDAHIDVCIEERVPIVVFFWDPPERAWVDRLHAAGAEVWMQIASPRGASDAVALGCDVLIAQGAESGGHLRGVAEGRPWLRSDLVRAVRTIAGDRLVLAAGGIADGESLAEALLEGADGAWVGTRFATSLESYAHDEYKRRVVAAKRNHVAQTTIFGPEWPGAPMHVLRNRVVNEWAGREHELPVIPPPPLVIGNTMFAGAPYAMPKFSVVLPTRDTTGDFEEMCWTAGGASCTMISSIKPAARIIDDMIVDAQRVLASL